MDTSLLTDDQPENVQLLIQSTKMEDSGVTKRTQVKEWEETLKLEPSTLHLAGHKQTGGQTGKGKRLSMNSDLSHEASSWTESERELKAEGERRGGMEIDEGVGLAGQEVGLKTYLKKEVEDEEKEAETEVNHLPEKASQVFRPAVTVLPSPCTPRNAEAFWEMESEKSPFLSSQEMDYNQHGYQFEWKDTPTATCGQCCPGRVALKMGVSLMTSALLFPFLVWGGFVFLPFDAPLLDGAPLRLVYTLRCSVFAAVPIVLGWLVLAVSRLRSGVTRPLSDDNMKEEELQEVSVHQRFISDSASLFLIYFLQLVVMAMYLSQEQLKLIPLMTILFAFGRLVYWVAAAFGSSIRSFGFGLSFLPSVAMMVANFYFIFTVEAAGSIFRLPPPSEEVPPPPAGRQRFWG
ncbi:transmembrane protein 79 [Melanotaenia boesemani]|uniref:transmembrane protein 79 n=1 Tax=Melanotaenia boesemani TaxID=1250792 RepID=UPI001C0486D5|nr:transmembrane protein 79 [Melanotaenia boesemani]